MHIEEDFVVGVFAGSLPISCRLEVPPRPLAVATKCFVLNILLMCFRLFRCVLRDDPAAMNGSEQTPGRRLRTPRFSGSSPPNTFEPPNSLIHTDAGQFVLSGPSSADEASDDETGNGDSANHSSRWSQQWSCPVCTFINPVSHNMCQNGCMTMFGLVWDHVLFSFCEPGTTSWWSPPATQN